MSLCDCVSFHCYPVTVTEHSEVCALPKNHYLFWLHLKTPTHFVFLKYILQPHQTPIPEMSTPGTTPLSPHLLTDVLVDPAVWPFTPAWSRVLEFCSLREDWGSNFSGIVWQKTSRLWPPSWNRIWLGLQVSDVSYFPEHTVSWFSLML